MKKIIFLLLPALCLFAAFRSTQNIIITGTVVSDKGNPVEGASVTAIGTRSGTATDINGSYRLSVSEKQESIRISGTGFQSQDVKINGQRIINVTLISVTQELNTVVVTALGIRSRSQSLGYASATVSNKTLNASRSTGVSQGLTGKVSGLSVNAGSYSKRKSKGKTATNYSGLNSPVADEASNTEEYSNIVENGFKKVSDDPLSTFSIDVDAASYSNVRRYLNGNQLPPAGAVRTEEMINYFKYQYPQPTGKDPFSINTEISSCPWNKDHRLVLIGLQGKNIPTENLPASNLVFLIDVSGSMTSENKLPLVKASLKLLTDQLREKDKISIVVYAGNAGLVLPATSGADKIKIKTAIDALEAGGSTAGGEGIQLAYKTAQENLIKNGNNRIILCTDGDFNVGVSSDDDMVRLVEGERNKGVFLTVLGYGMGNYKDSKMQQLADKGNGNHAYIDGIGEAKKVLVNEFSGTLFTIAKDVKLQLEFNPAKVAGYRLIGYENRLLNKEDFNDDKKDAGELGSGHTVTALYEIIPAGVKSSFLKEADPLKYQKNKKSTAAAGEEILTVKFRYKAPEKNISELIVHAVNDDAKTFESTSDNFRFATAVSEFSMLLRSSEFKGKSTYAQLLSIANASLGTDKEGYRTEFVSLVKKAEVLQKSKAAK